MTLKSFSTAILSFAGIATLPGQNLSTPSRYAGVNESDVSSLVSQLGQNALMVLLGMVVLMGIVCIFCIGNTCAGLNKKTKKRPCFPLAPLVMCGDRPQYVRQQLYHSTAGAGRRHPSRTGGRRRLLRLPCSA